MCVRTLDATVKGIDREMVAWYIEVVWSRGKNEFVKRVYMSEVKYDKHSTNKVDK